MNRFLLILLVWIFCGLSGWMAVANSPEKPVPPSLPQDAPSAVQREFILEITATFDAGSDPFALDGDGASGLKIYENGRELHHVTAFSAGETPLFFTLRPQSPSPEYRIRAFTATASSSPAALRARILEKATVLAEASAWSTEGPMDLFLATAPDRKARHAP